MYKRQPIEAQLVKTDEAGTPLAGAVFSIHGTFAGGYAQERKITLDPTDEDGIDVYKRQMCM